MNIIHPWRTLADRNGKDNKWVGIADCQCQPKNETFLLSRGVLQVLCVCLSYFINFFKSQSVFLMPLRNILALSSAPRSEVCVWSRL